MNLNIVNSGYDGEQQASDCEVAVAAQPDLIILWPAVGDEVRPCLEAANAAGIPVTVTNSDLIPEDQELSEAYSGPDTYGQGVSSAEMFCEFAGGEDVGILMVNGAPATPRPSTVKTASRTRSTSSARTSRSCNARPATGTRTTHSSPLRR